MGSLDEVGIPQRDGLLDVVGGEGAQGRHRRQSNSSCESLPPRTARVLAAMRQIAAGVASVRPAAAARLYAEIAVVLVMKDEPEIAAGLVLRGHTLLTAAGHPPGLGHGARHALELRTRLAQKRVQLREGRDSPPGVAVVVAFKDATVRMEDA